MGKNESHNSQLATEDDFKKVASYTERRDFVRSNFDKKYRGTTKENESLLKNNTFQKAYLERFSQNRSNPRESRMNIVNNRPDQHPEVQRIHNSLLEKLGSLFSQDSKTPSVSDRLRYSRTGEYLGRPKVISARGRVTTFQKYGDKTPDKFSSRGIGAFGKLQYGDLSVSRDIEQRLRKAGVRPGEFIQVKLANGEVLSTRWMDRTSSRLTGRFDFFVARGSHPKEDMQVEGVIV